MNASSQSDKQPDCFGQLERVFPMGDDGLRCSPDDCMACEFKTPCLRAAMQTKARFVVQDEMVDRAYESRQIGFWRRWSRKKAAHRQMSKKG